MAKEMWLVSVFEEGVRESYVPLVDLFNGNCLIEMPATMVSE